MAQFCRKAGPFVDAIRLEGDTRVPVACDPGEEEQGMPCGAVWIDARAGDWLVTDGENQQRVLTDEAFRQRYEPATDEARRLLA